MTTWVLRLALFGLIALLAHQVRAGGESIARTAFMDCMSTLRKPNPDHQFQVFLVWYPEKEPTLEGQTCTCRAEAVRERASHGQYALHRIGQIRIDSPAFFGAEFEQEVLTACPAPDE